MKKLILCAGLLIFLCAGLWGVNYTWTGGGNGSSWGDVNNWAPNTGWPGVGDTATISFGDVDLTSGPIVYLDGLTIDGLGSLDLQSNSLRVNGAFTLASTASLSGASGNFTVTGLSTIGSEINTGTGTQSYAAVTLGEDVTLTGTTVTIGDVLNGSGNSLTITSTNTRLSGVTVTDVDALGVTGDLAIDGMVTVTVDTAIFTVTGNVAVNLSSTLTMTATELSVTGDIQTASTGTLDMGSNDLSAATITNDGTLRLAGAGGQTVTPPSIGGTGPVVFTGNDTTLAGIKSFSNLTIEDGNRVVPSGPTDITVTGTTTITGGGLDTSDSYGAINLGYVSMPSGNGILTLAGGSTTGSQLDAGTVVFTGGADLCNITSFNNLTIQGGDKNVLTSLTVTGTTTITTAVTIKTSGDQTYNVLNLGAVQPKLTSTGGRVRATGKVSGSAGIDVEALNGILINNSGNDLSGDIVLNNGDSTANSPPPVVQFQTSRSITISGKNESQITLFPVDEFWVSATGDIEVGSAGITATTGTVTLISTGGTITQSDAITGVALNVSANKGITLGNDSNNVGTISLTNNGTDGNIVYYSTRAAATDTLIVAAVNDATDGNIDIRETVGNIAVNSGNQINTNGQIKVTAAGTINLYGGNITTAHAGNTDAAPAVYFSATNVLHTGGTTATGVLGTDKGIVDMWVDSMPATYVGYLGGASVPYHLHIRDRHLVYKDGTTPVLGFTPASDYFYVDASEAAIGNTPAFIVPSGFNAYVIDVIGSTKSPSFTVDGSGFIEFRGNYDSSGSLTLNPGSGGIQLNNAVIDLTDTAFNTNANVNLVGTGASPASSITANGITLAAIDNTSGVKNDLTLATNNASAVITVNGTVGSTINDRPGNITVDNAGTFVLNAAMNIAGVFSQSGGGTSVLAANITTENDSNSLTAISFGGAITLAANVTLHADTSSGGNIALSSTVDSDSTPGWELTLKTGAGNVTVAGAIGATEALGNINITGNDITFNSTVTSSGKTTITTAALFTAHGAISSDGGFEQNGSGTSLLKASGATVTTVETENTGITFANSIQLDNSESFTFSTGSGAGDISLANNVITPYAADITLIAGGGNITVSGAMGDAVDRLGAITVTSAADARFNGAIAAQSFLQSAGTGTTIFSAAQDYLGGFTFTGNALTVNSLLNTDTDTSNDDGAINITITSIFTVGASGQILPGGASGTITVTGNTENSGAIKAGPVVALDEIAIDFIGNYNYTTNIPKLTGMLVGNSQGHSYINFHRFAAFTGVKVTAGENTNNNTISFKGSAWHNVVCIDSSLLDDVIVETGHIVNVVMGTIKQQDDAKLTLKAGTTRLDAITGSWYMGSGTPSADSGFTTGFAGFSGELIMNANTTLSVRDFYNDDKTGVPSATVHRITINGENVRVTAGHHTEHVNVTINREFWPASGYDFNDSTLEMTSTGTLKVLMDNVVTHPHTRASISLPKVNIGNFVVGTYRYDANPDPNITEYHYRHGNATLDSNIYIRGNVTIGSNCVLNGGSNHIFVFPLTQGATPANTWTQLAPNPLNSWETKKGEFRIVDDSGVIVNSPTVEFGNCFEPSFSGNTYYIEGDTTWYTLACHEPGATLSFSNYVSGAQGHTVYHLLEVQPYDSGVVSSDESDMIELTRIDPYVYSSGYPNAPIQIPPTTPNNYFWYFFLAGGASLDLNYVKITYSYSRTRIPVPDESAVSQNWRVDAWPYVLVTNGTPDPGNASSHWNVDWFVFRNFFYGYTEDSNHNGKIDRVRLQAAFNVIDESDDPNAFRGFRISVRNNRTGDWYSVRRYRRVEQTAVPASTDLDSIYVLLEEMPYLDTGDTLHWRVEQNTTLWDLTTYNPTEEQGSVLIGVQDDPETGEKADEGDTWDTAPPRIAYALAIPGYNELFFQMSENVNMASAAVTALGETGVSPTPVPHGDGKEYLVTLSSSEFTPGDLTANPPNMFTLSGVTDGARPATDLKNTNRPYRFMYPSPKYPQNYNYDSDGGGYQQDGYPTTFQPYVTVFSNASGDPQWPPIPPSTEVTITLPNQIYDLGNGAPGTVSHRYSDMLVSIPPKAIGDGDYFMWPLWAKYKDSGGVEPGGILGTLPPGYGYMGQDEDPLIESSIIWDFTGKRFLERKDDIVMLSRLDSGSETGVNIVWAKNVPDVDKSTAGLNGITGLWYPTGLLEPHNPAFVNLVPRFFEHPEISLMDSSQNPFFKYTFEEGEFNANTKVEFYFQLFPVTQQNLLAGRLDMVPGTDIPGDWYRRVRPFVFDIHDITRQRGGVTILNNVIKAGSERVYIDYKPESSGRVTIQVFTLDGNLVKVLKRESYTKAGDEYERVSWDGRNNGGRPVARGMYFVRIVAPGIDEIRKVMVVK